MKTLKFFPRKIVVTVKFKSGHAAKFACDDFSVDGDSWKASGVIRNMYDGVPGHMKIDQVESFFGKTRRIFTIYWA
jgi:hypothetical protein